MRYLAALLAVICLLGAAALALFACVTTEFFAREVNAPQSLQQVQQARIDAQAAALNARWNLAPDVLASVSEDAAHRQGEAVAAWWGDLWRDPDADLAPPAFLDSAAEGALVADIRKDAGFIALTDEAQRRAIARDDIAYALDEAVCDAVMPLRRSLLEMFLTLASDVVALPTLRMAVIMGAGVLAVLALVLMILARRAWGSILVATALVMLGLAVPVLMLDVPGMLAQLSEIAALQGQVALACLGILWGGAAAVLLLTGLAVLGVKAALRRDEA